MKTDKAFKRLEKSRRRVAEGLAPLKSVRGAAVRVGRGMMEIVAADEIMDQEEGDV